jgi:hypothetical protein
VLRLKGKGHLMPEPTPGPDYSGGESQKKKKEYQEACSGYIQMEEN